MTTAAAWQMLGSALLFVGMVWVLSVVTDAPSASYLVLLWDWDSKVFAGFL